MGSGRFHAMQIQKGEGVTSIEVIDDDLRDRYIRKEDIIAHLHSFYIDMANNHQDMELVLKILFQYRQLFRYILTFRPQNFFVDRASLVRSIETMEDMERRISHKLLKVVDLNPNVVKIPKYLNKIDTPRMESFLHNKEVKLITYTILQSFETNLNLKRENT